MKKRIILGALLFLLGPCPFLSTSPGDSSLRLAAPPAGRLLSPQEYPAKKPKYDYMSTFFSRNTKPLGLKEDLALKKLLGQPSIKWAIRTGIRHILD